MTWDELVSRAPTKERLNKKQKFPSRIFPKIEYNTAVFAFHGCFGRDSAEKGEIKNG